MSITIKVHPKTKRVIAVIEDSPNILASGLQQALLFMAPKLVKEAERLIDTGPKTGRVYMYRGRSHQASAPFEAPANRSGRLRGSLHSSVYSPIRMEFGSALSRSEPPYSRYLEDGTRNMKPRQLILKTVNNEARNFQMVLVSVVDKEFRKHQ